MKIKGLLIALLCVSSFAMIDAAKRTNTKTTMCSQAACGKDSSCECYCSVKCGPREQDEEDRPVFAKEDSDGKSVPAACYCKPNDLNEYNRHCSPDASKKILKRRRASRSARRTTVQSN